MKRTTISTLAVLALITAAVVRASEEEATDERHVRKIVIECQGEDCEHQAYAFKSGKAPFAFSHGDHDFHFFGPARGFLGVQFLPLTPELSQHFNTGAERGAMVSKVIEDSPAAAAGLQVGDVITSVNGEELGHGSLFEALAGKEGGDAVDLGVVRNGRNMILSPTLEERELGFAPRSARIGKKEIEVRGLHGKVGMINTDELCEGLEECKVKIACEDEEDCACEVNGAAVDCP